MQSALSVVFWSQIRNVPLVLACGVGIALALARWRRHPSVSLCALLACAAFLLSQLVGAGMLYWQTSARDRGGFESAMGYISFGALVGRLLLGVLGSVLAIMAVFGWRASPMTLAHQTGPNPREGYEAPRA